MYNEHYRNLLNINLWKAKANYRQFLLCSQLRMCFARVYTKGDGCSSNNLFAVYICTYNVCVDKHISHEHIGQSPRGMRAVYHIVHACLGDCRLDHDVWTTWSLHRDCVWCTVTNVYVCVCVEYMRCGAIGTNIIECAIRVLWCQPAFALAACGIFEPTKNLNGESGFFFNLFESCFFIYEPIWTFNSTESIVSTQQRTCRSVIVWWPSGICYEKIIIPHVCHAHVWTEIKNRTYKFVLYTCELVRIRQVGPVFFFYAHDFVFIAINSCSNAWMDWWDYKWMKQKKSIYRQMMVVVPLDSIFWIIHVFSYNRNTLNWCFLTVPVSLDAWRRMPAKDKIKDKNSWLALFISFFFLFLPL